MDWNTIANISALATCTTFILYIIGHIWTIHISKNKIFEKFEFEECQNVDYDECIDFATKCGRTFSISSPEGINSIKIYEAKISENLKELFSKGNLLRTINDIKPNQKVYIRAEFSDFGSNIYLEIKRADYIKTSFVVADNGKDGRFAQENYKSQMTITSWIYYLCK